MTRHTGKVFCIGRNKTGTTSLKHVLESHQYTIGDQSKAELLIQAYAKRNFKRIARYCNSAQAFQDIPFSLPHLYVYLDNHFPKSKFILSVRSSPEEWYNSLVNFHVDKFDSNKSLPTKTDIYNKKHLMKSYRIHNQQVKDYFRHKNNLLVLNLSQENSYRRLCKFLGLEQIFQTMPQLNKAQ